MQNYRSSLPKEEIEESVGERDGRSNSLVSIHPSLPFCLQPPCLWFGESFIPPIMLCIGAGWEGGVYGLTSCCCCCFLHAFLPFIPVSQASFSPSEHFLLPCTGRYNQCQDHTLTDFQRGRAPSSLKSRGEQRDLENNFGSQNMSSSPEAWEGGSGQLLL